MPVDQSLIVEFGQWLDTPPGRYVRKWEQGRIDAMVSNIFGYHAIQIGLPHWDLLQANRIPNRWRAHLLESGAAQSGTSLVVDPENMPFDAQSVDLLVLPHGLEGVGSPHQVLREAERVLMPEGRVVISGFNPVSLWGVRERIPGLDPLLPVPAHEQVSLARLKDWFALLSLEPERGRFGCYAPLCKTDLWLDRWSFMEAAGDRWWAVCGSVYVVSAVKRVAGVRLVGPASWKAGKPRVRRQAVVAGRYMDKH